MQGLSHKRIADVEYIINGRPLLAICSGPLFCVRTEVVKATVTHGIVVVGWLCEGNTKSLTRRRLYFLQHHKQNRWCQSPYLICSILPANPWNRLLFCIKKRGCKNKLPGFIISHLPDLRRWRLYRPPATPGHHRWQDCGPYHFVGRRVRSTSSGMLRYHYELINSIGKSKYFHIHKYF